MNILEIKNFPTTRENIHESVYRSYQTLQKVKEMLRRKDSGETILDVIEAIELAEPPVPKALKRMHDNCPLWEDVRYTKPFNNWLSSHGMDKK